MPHPLMIGVIGEGDPSPDIAAMAEEAVALALQAARALPL
jgi:hypothetical protein